VPLWLPLAAAWIPTGLAWNSLRRRTAHPWLCETCGYDLTGRDPADLCPECQERDHLPG
jgi:rubrerythrin